MKTRLKEYKVYVVVIILVVLGVVVYKLWNDYKLNNFAECVSGNTKFYGASWCPNCLAQKELFGKAASKLNYIECSLDVKAPQEKICADAKIGRYPTWIFADGSKFEGVIYLDTLSKKTGCAY
jgi:thiol-disulfide isomerase/thioredoxin